MPWHPSLYERKAQADNIIGTLDDIIIDNQPKYLMLRESVRSRAKATIEFESWQHPSEKVWESFYIIKTNDAIIWSIMTSSCF